MEGEELALCAEFAGDAVVDVAGLGGGRRAGGRGGEVGRAEVEGWVVDGGGLGLGLLAVRGGGCWWW